MIVQTCGIVLAEKVLTLICSAIAENWYNYYADMWYSVSRESVNILICSAIADNWYNCYADMWYSVSRESVNTLYL